MKDAPCEHSPAIREALKSGSWTPELRRHAAACPGCRQEIQVQEWLLQLAQTTQDETPPVSPHLLWLKAQLAEKQRAQREALRPLAYVQVAIEMFIGIACLFVLMWNWTGLEHRLNSLTLDKFTSSIVVFEGGVSLGVMLLLVVAVLSFGLLITFNAFAREQ